MLILHFCPYHLWGLMGGAIYEKKTPPNFQKSSLFSHTWEGYYVHEAHPKIVKFIFLWSGVQAFTRIVNFIALWSGILAFTKIVKFIAHWVSWG